MKFILSLPFFLALFLAPGCATGPDTLPSKPVVAIKVLHKERIIELPVEEYVARVLAGEVSESWPMEALKAQAIAARTFAIKKMGERPKAQFHIKSSVMDQVFKTKTRPKFQEATKETSGLVLTDGKRLVETSFHSTCGGSTTSAQSVWGQPHSHLTGVKCPYCRHSPTHSWTYKMPLWELEEKLGTKISSLKILGKTKDGRIDKIAVNGAKPTTISGHKLRSTIGHMKLKSTLLDDLKVAGGTIEFSGHGFGHGVGMCQYGAMGMAKKGFDARQILGFYYPKTKIMKLY